jgi:hypothetical protein
MPLLEGASAVLDVQDRLNPQVIGILLDDLAAVIGRGIVENDQLEILKRLLQDAIEPPGQVPGVIVIRGDDGDSRHIASSLESLNVCPTALHLAELRL